MVDLQLTIHDAELQSAIAELGESINDWSGAWPGVAEAIRGIMREQFESEGARGPLGGWAPLSTAYAARKAKDRPGKPLMRSTDRLYESLTGSLTGDSPDTVFDVLPGKLTVGTRVPYAAYSQPAQAEGRQPRRALYDLTEFDAAAVAVPLHSVARAVAQKLGFGIR